MNTDERLTALLQICNDCFCLWLCEPLVELNCSSTRSHLDGFVQVNWKNLGFLGLQHGGEKAGRGKVDFQVFTKRDGVDLEQHKRLASERGFSSTPSIPQSLVDYPIFRNWTSAALILQSASCSPCSSMQGTQSCIGVEPRNSFLLKALFWHPG